MYSLVTKFSIWLAKSGRRLWFNM